MSGTVVTTEETFGTVKKVKFEWTSASDGTATATTSNAYSGVIQRLVTIPDGTSAPSDDYDVAINDEDGTDVLMGAGADRSNTDTEQVLASSLGIVANDSLSLAISNAGSAKSGTVIVYIR